MHVFMLLFFKLANKLKHKHKL